MERGSARVRVCQKQEEKSATRSGICISEREAAFVSVNRGILFIKHMKRQCERSSGLHVKGLEQAGASIG